MITVVPLQWLLSLMFIVTTAYALYWLVVSKTRRDRIGYLAHALMGLAMLAMVWPATMNLLLFPQTVIFTMAAVWFVIAAAQTAGRGAASAPSSSLSPKVRGHHDSRGTLAYHAVMMAAMTMMALAMMGMGDPGGMDAAASGGAAHDHGSMPGMDMSATGGAAMVSPLWVNIAAVLAAVGFAIAALYFLGRALAAATANGRATRAGRFHTIDAVWNLLMAVGMSALFLPLISWG